MTKSKSLVYIFLLPCLILLVINTSGCNQENLPALTPKASPDSIPTSVLNSPVSTTAFNSPVAASTFLSPLTSVTTLPFVVPTSSLANDLTSLPLTGEMTYTEGNKKYKAPYISAPFYSTLAWTDITWDGEKGIWAVNNELKAFVHFDMKTGSMVKTIPFPKDLGPTPNITGLTREGEYLWIVDINSHKVYKIDPDGSKVITDFKVGGTPEGLAWDGDGL